MTTVKAEIITVSEGWSRELQEYIAGDHGDSGSEEKIVEFRGWVELVLLEVFGDGRGVPASFT